MSSKEPASEKVALVTGGNRGIGFAIARQLANKGIRVIIGARDISHGEAAAKDISHKVNVSVSSHALDVTDQASVNNLARAFRVEHGRRDILVNNAGVLLDETSLPSETDLQIVRLTLETNLIGAWRLCKAFIPGMKKNGYGRIVNVSSGAGAIETMTESLYAPAYSLSKAGLNALTMMLAREVRGTNILVNAMCPGWVRTKMGGSSAPRSPEEGADTAVWLATLPDKDLTGGFFLDRKRIEW